MTEQMTLDLAHQAVTTAALASAPMLLTAIVVGVAVNILQTVTSMRDMSLSFVPKLVASAVVLLVTLPWWLRILIDYFVRMFGLMGELGG